MADTEIYNLTDGTTAEATDRIPITRDPTGTPLDRYITPSYISTYVSAQMVGTANTWTAAQTFSPSTDATNFSRTTNPQSVYVYNTTDGGSNYERVVLQFSGNDARLFAQNGGTGTLRQLHIGGGTTVRIYSGSGAASRSCDFSGTGPWAVPATAIPAGGTANTGLRFSSTASFGIFFGSGAPTLSAAQGSLYLRSDGSGTGDRAYINTDGSTTWTALTTAA